MFFIDAVATLFVTLRKEVIVMSEGGGLKMPKDRTSWVLVIVVVVVGLIILAVKYL